MSINKVPSFVRPPSSTSEMTSVRSQGSVFRTAVLEPTLNIELDLSTSQAEWRSLEPVVWISKKEKKKLIYIFDFQYSADGFFPKRPTVTS